MNIMWLQMKLAKAQVSLFMLFLILQRTPIIKYAMQLEKAVNAPIAKMVRAFTVTAASIGGLHSLSGATEYVVNPASPADATVGEEFSLAFSIIDTPATADYWEISGTIPPGLSISGLSEGRLESQSGTITGIPTEAGTYDVIVKPYHIRPQGTDYTTASETITINVTGPPVFIWQPRSIKAPTGGRAQFYFQAEEGVDTIQWLKDDVPLDGENGATLIITDVQAAAEGSYSVELTNGAGTTVSSVANLSIDDDAEANFVNLATRGRVGVDADILIPGFTVLGGAAKTVLFRGLGPELEQFGINDFLPDPQIELVQTIYENGLPVGQQVLFSNDDWETGPGAAELAEVMQSTGKTLPAGSKDAALLVTLGEGVYTIKLSGVNASVGVGLAELFVIE